MAAWVAPAIAAAGSVIGGLLGGGGDSGSGGVSTHKPKILPKTESGEQQSQQDFIFDEAAIGAMSDLADQIGEFADYNESFIRDIYQPVQEQMLRANSSMIPQMEDIAGASLEQMSKDLVSNETLKGLITARMQGDADPNSLTNKLMKSYETELENLPTEQERVGQALSQVESQFKGAGKQLAKDFASRGQSVSQASKRDLLMNKATAKAGIAETAAEGARKERLSAMERGVNTSQSVRANEEAISNQAQQGLLGLQQANASMGVNARNALFDPDKTDATGIRGQEMALTGQLGVLQRGATSDTKQLSHTQKGIKSRPEVQEDGSIKIGSKILQSDEYKKLKDKMGDFLTEADIIAYAHGGQAVSGGNEHEYGDQGFDPANQRTMTDDERAFGRGVMDMGTGGLFGDISDAIGGLFGGGGNDGGSSGGDDGSGGADGAGGGRAGDGAGHDSASY